MPMFTKLCRMITYLDGLLPLKSQDPLVTWPCKITWQNKTNLSSLSEYLWLLNLARWWLTMMGSCLLCYMTLWLRGRARSPDKLKSICFHYRSVYGHQTQQNGNLPWWAPAYKVTLPFDHVVLWDYVTN